jgi:hypothetical protein
MRVGLMPAVGDPPLPTYDSAYYPLQTGAKQCPVDHRYRTFAGDAMYYTLKTMEVFKNSFQGCGFDGSCGRARVVVDACGCQAGAQFTAFDDPNNYSPINSVKSCKTPAGYSPASSALDIVAHEWGHGVSKYSPADFASPCKYLFGDYPETCEMSEGFADVVGHIVERIQQPLQDDGSWLPEHWDWTAGEDAAGTFADRLRRADLFDTRVCTQPEVDFHYSVHAEDPGCEYEDPQFNNHIPEHSNGNRLAVVFKLMSGPSPAYPENYNPAHGVPGLPFPCTGCDINVTPLDPVPGTSFQMAAHILFRVLDTEADASLVDWDYLPYYARGAIQDLYVLDPQGCEDAQESTFDAFRAVGYPQQMPVPSIVQCVAQPPCPPFCEE